MSIPNDQIPKVEQVVSGGGVTEISFPFYVVDSATVYVLVDGVPVSSGWHVELNSYVPESEDEEDSEEPVSSEYEVETGRVVFDSAVVAGATVTVYRSTPMTQDVALGQGSSFYPQVIEEALDKVVMGMQELRGGTVNIPGEGAASAVYAQSAGSASSAGYATTANYAYSAGLAFELDSNFVANSAYHATTAAGLDNGVIVASAGYADSAGTAAAANGAGYATSASTADVASSLTSGAKDDILSSAGGKYEGPWNASFTGEDEVGIAGGNVFAGGKMYAYQGGGCDAESGDTIYLVLSSRSDGAKPVDSYTTNPPSTADDPRTDLLITRIAKNEGGVLKQYQFGDIACVPWGAEGGGTVSAYARQISSGYEAPSPGIVFANAVMTNGDATGNEANITTDDNPWVTYAKVPQGGPSGGWAPDGDPDRGTFNSGVYGCSYTMSVSSGAIVKLGGSLPQTVYFLGFGSDPNN